MVIITGYLLEKNGKSCLIKWKIMNEMSKRGRRSVMHAYVILLHTLFMITNVYHAYCYMIN